MIEDNFILDLKQRGLGDTIVATNLVRDLKLSHPKSCFRVIGTQADDVFLNNPYADQTIEDGVPIDIDMKSPIDDMWLSGGGNYVHAMHIAWTRETGIAVERREPGIDIILSKEEEAPLVKKPYWVVVSGYKTDMPVKRWNIDYFQEVVNTTSFAVKWVQAGIRNKHNRQQDLRYATNLINKTSVRQFFSLIKNASGVLCLLSMPMWVACAFNKPCIVLAGGREPAFLYRHENWSTQTIFSTIGQYPCCRLTGCGRLGVTPAHSGEYPKNYLCSLPVLSSPSVAKCMSDIRPREVGNEVLRLNSLS